MRDVDTCRRDQGFDPARGRQPGLYAHCRGIVRGSQYQSTEFDPETNLYVGIAPGVPGAHSQGATLDELHGNLKEVLELCIEDLGESFGEWPKFVGLQQIEIAMPNHPGRDQALPLTREILREIAFTPEQFRRELDR